MGSPQQQASPSPQQNLHMQSQAGYDPNYYAQSGQQDLNRQNQAPNFSPNPPQYFNQIPRPNGIAPGPTGYLQQQPLTPQTPQPSITPQPPMTPQPMTPGSHGAPTPQQPLTPQTPQPSIT